MHLGNTDISGVIFDMDGTLLDSMTEWKLTADKLLGGFGITPDKEDYEHFMKTPAYEVGRYLVSRYSFSITADMVAEEIDNLIAEAYMNFIQPKLHIPELLEYFSNKGIKMAVATASGRQLAESAFNRTGIMQYFEGIISCADIGKGKTEPDVYYKAMELLELNLHNTAVMEDAYYAVCTAKKAGFFVIGIYDDLMCEDKEKIKAAADLWVEDPADIYMKRSKDNEKA